MRLIGPEMLTVAETAQYLRLHPDTIRVWARRGEFQGAVRVRCGRSFVWRIPRTAVLAKCELWMPEGERPPGPTARELTVEEQRKMWPGLAELGIV